MFQGEPQMAHFAQSKGGRTRQLVLHEAAGAFAARGYDSVTLEQIGAPFGLSKSAILYHFTKAELLCAIVRPLLVDVDVFLCRAEADRPGTPRRTRAALGEFVQIVCDHRSAAALITRDATAQQHLPPELQIRLRTDRFVRLFAPSGGTDSRICAFAALGAVMRAVAVPPDDLISATSRVEYRSSTAPMPR
jgi:AcrR family transcriptional regulator